MSKFVEMVRDASGPREALMLIAAAIERVEIKLAEPLPVLPADEWSDWKTEVMTADSTGVPVRINMDGDDAIVELPPVGLDRLQARSHFAEHTLQLPMALGPDEDWISAYAKGGPMWLYLTDTGRDLIMAYPDHVKRAMVQDVEETSSVRDAQEMARDILKVGAGPPSSLGDD